jgi:hypothetical protein
VDPKNSKFARKLTMQKVNKKTGELFGTWDIS